MSTKELLLGIDIGTSSCKVAVFDVSGTIVASETATYPVTYEAPGWASQDPEDWTRGVYDCIRRILDSDSVSAKDICAIGIDGQGWAAVAVDREGHVLCDTPIWMDMRAVRECEDAISAIGKDTLFSLTGNPITPSYTTPKVLWYKEHRPDVYAHADKILQSNSFLVYRLTGVYSQDLSQGYAWHCFDMRQGKWDMDMARSLEIREDLLTDIYPCHAIVGHVSENASRDTGLVAGTPVVAGGLDAACGTLGAGVIHPGQTQEQGGQAGGMSICLSEYTADPRLILGYHVVPDEWLLQGGTTGGGGTMRWFEQEFADYEREHVERGSSLTQINDMAKKIPAGSEGLVFLPYMSGERTPIWDPDAKGVFYGLDFSKTKAHFARAIMEGVAFSLRHNLEVAKEAGASVDELIAVGGSANSKLWTQIKADVTGKKIAVPFSDAATTLGAAILAGVGVGAFASFEEAVGTLVHIDRRHEPDDTDREIYTQNYAIYREIYENLKQTMHSSDR